MLKSLTSDRASSKSSHNSSIFHRESERDAFVQPKLNKENSNNTNEIEADQVVDCVLAKTYDTSNVFFLAPTAPIKDVHKIKKRA